MLTWLHITLISGFAVVIIILILILICKKSSHDPSTPPNIIATNAETYLNEEASFHQHQHQNLEEEKEEGSYNKKSNPLFRQRKPYFSWSDHPSLVAHAVEHGWSRFSFAPSPSLKYYSTDSLSGGLLPTHVNDTNLEISWEVFDESIDYMQKIRVKESKCVIRACLPLPGPQFANASFPKEAYFEIRILHNHQLKDDKGKTGSGTTSKIVEEDDFKAKVSDLECLKHDTRSNIDSKRSKIEEELKVREKEECEDELNLVAIGLSSGKGGRSINVPLKELPGSFVGSVGFNSSGAVYLDGRKLIGESENDVGWGRAGNVIGCGYNPSQRKVFFTVNSQLVYEIRCKTEDFSHPLYPTLAAHGGISVVVNLGQSPFRFETANSQRTSNPCFVTTRASCSATAPYYELDSKELFSMGRIDGKWKHRRGGGTKSSESLAGDYDDLSEADLFEIVAR